MKYPNLPTGSIPLPMVNPPISDLEVSNFLNKLSWIGGPVQTPTQVAPPSVIDAPTKNEASEPADSTHSPQVSGNGKCVGFVTL